MNSNDYYRMYVCLVIFKHTQCSLPAVYDVLVVHSPKIVPKFNPFLCVCVVSAKTKYI